MERMLPPKQTSLETRQLLALRKSLGLPRAIYPAWGPFHKSFCARVNTPAGLHFMLGRKLNPAKGDLSLQ